MQLSWPSWFYSFSQGSSIQRTLISKQYHPLGFLHIQKPADTKTDERQNGIMRIFRQYQEHDSIATLAQLQLLLFPILRCRIIGVNTSNSKRRQQSYQAVSAEKVANFNRHSTICKLHHKIRLHTS